MIKNLLALSALLVLVFAAVGWYMDWYRIETNTTPDGRRTIQIDLDSPRISEDLNEGKKKLHKILAPDEPANQQQKVNSFAPKQDSEKTNQVIDNFWFDDESTFVYPATPNTEQADNDSRQTPNERLPALPELPK